MSEGSEPVAPAGGRGVRIVVEYCEPCGFESTYLELASAVKDEYPDIDIESRLGGKGAFEIEINGQLVFSKLENGGFPYEKDHCGWEMRSASCRGVGYSQCFGAFCRELTTVVMKIGNLDQKQILKKNGIVLKC
ncbi:migration and invasion enhancer 1 isoform X1 [Emydura macquarii macquarii]|uniref:migration and invasion enhancer 1 isoform X1 n=1 Tax=Emydura macquarii macquarii TaxID=1129001 RepID=UPI00352A3874